MIPRWLILLLLMTVAPASRAQDQRLDSLKKMLPKNWGLAMSDTDLVIKRKDTVWLLHDMRLNAPVKKQESREEYIARIQKYGHKIVPYYSFRTEPKWSLEKRKEVLAANRSVDEAIQKLPAKYGIEKLRDNYLSAKGHDFYVAKNQRDSLAIAGYTSEKAKMELQKKPFPDFSTSRLSLFKKRVFGHESELNILWPFEAGREMSTIDRKMREICNDTE